MKNGRKLKDYNPSDCPVTFCLNKIGGKWKPIVFYHVSRGVARFNELMKVMPKISKQMLVIQLRELEEDGLITREIFAEVPPRVEYKITKYGASLMPILKLMAEWGKAEIKRSIKQDKLERVN